MRHLSINGTAYVLFEPERDELLRITTEAGFQAEVERQERVVLVSVLPVAPRPMFFDAAETRQAPRMAAARTFASGATGVVFNTPFVLEFLGGSSVRIRISTEIRWDVARKFPHGACETSLLVLFQQLVQDLATGMVGVCGMAPSARSRALAAAR
jgi:hypothetical protein